VPRSVDDHLFLAVGDPQVALGIEGADIAGVQPAPGVDRFGGLARFPDCSSSAIDIVPCAGSSMHTSSMHTMCSTTPPALRTRSANCASQMTTRLAALANTWAICSGAKVL
jgi:hypothetical protein